MSESNQMISRYHQRDFVKVNHNNASLFLSVILTYIADASSDWNCDHSERADENVLRRADSHYFLGRQELLTLTDTTDRE